MSKRALDKPGTSGLVADQKSDAKESPKKKARCEASPNTNLSTLLGKLMEHKYPHLAKVRTITESEYVLEKILGESIFGHVVSAYHKTTQMRVAIKISSLERISSNEQRRVTAENPLQEMEIYNDVMQCVRDQKQQHPGASHVISLLDEFLFDGCHWAVFELATHGDGFSAMEAKNCAMTEEQAKPLFRQLLQGLAFLHANGVAHLDIKPENLLMTSESTLKIADFGMAQWARAGSSLKGSLGTTKYMSPEAYHNLIYSPFLADVYSVGGVLFLWLTNSHAYESPTLDDPRFCCIWEYGKKGLEHLFESYNEKLPESNRIKLSPPAIDLLSRMLCPQETRWSIALLLKHEWFK